MKKLNNHVEKTRSLSAHTKINSKYIKNLNIRYETWKFLGENPQKYCISNHFLNRTQEITTRTDKWDCIKLKSFA
jgi:hypothetical protein